jgi:hypothetical protein
MNVQKSETIKEVDSVTIQTEGNLSRDNHDVSKSLTNKLCSRLAGFLPTDGHFSAFGFFSALEANPSPPTRG